MTPRELKEARQSLGLTQAQAAPLLGYGSVSRVSEIERGIRAPGETVVRLLRAYLDGYRPADWPGTERDENSGKTPGPMWKYAK